MATQYISYSSRNGGSGGVSTLNGLSGALTLAAGSGITITPSGGNTLTISTVAAAPVWGTITGTLSSQTDLQNALNLKANLSGAVFTGAISATNLSGTNSGDISLGTASGLSLVGQVLSLGLSSTSTTGALSSTDWNTFNGKQAAGAYITALTGDATASGPGSVPITLATVNSNVGSFGTASSVPTVTVNGKGLVTAAANTSIQIAESQVTNLVSDLAGKQPLLTFPLATSLGGTGTGTTLTQGSVVFADPSGNYTEDNTNFKWDNTNKRLSLGGHLSTAALGISVTGTQVGLDLTTTASNTAFQVSNQGAQICAQFINATNSATQGAAFGGAFSRGTNAARTAVQAGDQVATFSGQSYNGASFGPGFNAAIAIIATENQTSSRNGGELVIATTPNGSLAPVAGLVVNQDQTVQLPHYATDGFVKFSGSNGTLVSSNAIAPASLTLTNNHVLVGNGSNVAVDVAMSGDVAIVSGGATTIQPLAVTNSKIANATIDLTTKVTGLLPPANMGSIQYPQEKWVSIIFGDDSTGDGSFQRPWKTLAHAGVSLGGIATLIHMTGTSHDQSVGTITLPNNIAVVSDSPSMVIQQPVVIASGGSNTFVSLVNLTIQNTFTWVDSQVGGMELALDATQISGLTTFKNTGAGSANSALFANEGALVGLDALVGQVNFQDVALLGALNYEDSGAAYLIINGGDLAGAISLNGGVNAWFTGALADAGYSITGTTTGSGTPAIIADSGSIPATISGSYTLALTSLAQHVGYTPAAPGDWSVVPSQVSQALDALAANMPGGIVPVAHGGTGLASLTAHDVLVGNGTGNVSLISPSTAGFVLTSNGVGADPSFQVPAVSPSAITLTNNHVLVGNASNVAVDVAMSGDLSIASGGATTLATVNSNVGSFGSSTSIPSFTVNAKGLITAASGNAVIAPAGTLSGATLNAGVVNSSLTSVGTIATGVWNGTKLDVTYGGTGQVNLANHSVLIGNGTSGISQIVTSTSGFVFTSNGPGVDPSFQAPAPVTPGSITLTNNHILVGNASNVGADVAMSGDVSIVASGATSIASIQGTTVSGTTGSGNVVFSASPTLTGTITAAAANFSGAISASNLSGTNTGDVSLAAVGAVPNANGASLSGQVLNLQPANASFPGALLAADWTTFNNKQPAGNYITALTGDATASGPGSSALTLATVNSNVGSFTNASITVNAKGLITAASNGTAPVTSISVASANGLAGTSSGGATPALTLSTTITGILQGNGTAISAASTTGSGNVVLATAPTLSNPIVGTQTQNDNSTKGASTAYVDLAIANALAGVNPAVAVQAATTAASDTSGFTYNNGVSGIGATLTGSTNTAIVIDGFTFTTLGQRLLVKNDTQSPSGAFNGVYYVTQVQTGVLPPVLTRALDYDMPSDINNTGAIPVINGTVNGTTQWVLTTTVVTVGTSPLSFTLFSKNPATIGTVSSVALTVPSFLSVSGSPITTSGTLAITLATESANTVFAGPASGAAATPTFRSLTVADQTIATQAVSASAIDWSLGNIYTKTLGANTTFTFSNQISGQTIVVRLTNTGSNWTVTWPSVRWSGGSAPSMSTGAVSDVYTFIYDGSNTYGSYVQNMS